MWPCRPVRSISKFSTSASDRPARSIVRATQREARHFGCRAFCMLRCGLRVLSRRCSCLSACGGSIPPLLLGFSACASSVPPARASFRRCPFRSVCGTSALRLRSARGASPLRSVHAGTVPSGVPAPCSGASPPSRPDGARSKYPIWGFRHKRFFAIFASEYDT